MKVLWFLWRIGIPILALAGIITACVLGFPAAWNGNPATSALFYTVLILVGICAIVLVTMLIEGLFGAVYRGALPVLMGMIGIAVFFLMVMLIGDIASGETVRHELFGNMKFYSSMLIIGLFFIAEALWIGLTLLIQGLPQAALWPLIIGGIGLAATLVVTFLFWIVMMLIYFFAHYYKIFFTVVGSTLGGLYLIFLVVYSIIRRAEISKTVKNNLDKYWRKA